MKIVCVYGVDDFISTKKPLMEAYQVPFGLSSIMTILEQAGHQIELLVYTAKTSNQVLIDTLKTHKPQLVMFSCIFTNFEMLCEQIESVKQYDASILTLMGGAHVSLNPELIMEKSKVDAICMGEGEYVIKEYIDCLEKNIDYTQIKGMWIRTQKEIFKNPCSEFIQDLDALPYINRKIWRKWILRPDSRNTIVVGRGCPFQCSYCSNHALAKVANGKYYRLRSIENVIGEIKKIVEEFENVKNIYFEIETMSVEIDYLLNLCEALKTLNDTLAVPIKFGTNFTVTKEVIAQLDLIAKKMKDANFEYINTGLESGKYELRSDVLRRPDYTNEFVIAFCQKMNSSGIKTYLYALVGIPDETLDDFKQTIEVVKQAKPSYVYLNIVCPYPGTDLYQYADQRGYLKEKPKGKQHLERRQVYVHMPNFTKKQIMHEYRMFPYYAFKGNWGIGKIILHILLNNIYTNQTLNNIFFRVVGGVNILAASMQNHRKIHESKKEMLEQ